jgi:hypothetical protein
MVILDAAIGRARWDSAKWLQELRDNYSQGNNTSSFTPEEGMAILGERSLTRNNIEFATAYDLAIVVIGQPLNDTKIKAYQRTNGLTEDGVIGFDTYSKMLEQRVPVWGDAIGTTNAQEVINNHSESPITGANLSQISISPVDAINLASKYINPLTHEGVKAWQADHEIDNDGRIGKETYIEVLAGDITWNVVDALSNKDISQTLENKVILTLEHGNLTWKNLQRLQIILKNFQNAHENSIEVTNKFQKIFNALNHSWQRFAESEEGQAAIERAWETKWRDGRSLYAIATDEEMSVSDRVWAIVSDPMLLIWGGIMFLFGVFWSNTRFTDSFMKRIWVVLGWLFFGPAIWNKLGVWEALEDLDNNLGITDGFNSLFDGTSWDVRERITQVRNQEWNDLNRLFPQEELLNSTLAHFENIDALRGLSLDNLEEYISNLNSGNTDNVPRFLKEITVDWVRLSNEQTAIILASLKETRTPWDSVIWDLFENVSTANIVWGALTWAGILWGLMFWFPAIATWTLVGWAVTLAVEHSDILDSIDFNSILAPLQSRSTQVLNSINNETLRNTLIELWNNSEVAFETRIERYKELAWNHEEFRNQINELIDINITAYTKWLNAISQNIERVNLGSASETLAQLIPLIEENVTDTEKKQRLLTLIRERVSVIESETEVRRVTDARTWVETIESDILVLRASIDALIAKRQRLLEERNTAEAHRLTEIDLRLRAIPTEIEWFEAQIAEKEIELGTARGKLANIEVEISIPVTQSHTNFIENELQNAISAQWIVTAVTLNASLILGIDTQVNDIREKISRAEDSSNKTRLIWLLDTIEGFISELRGDFRTEYDNGEVTAESIDAMNFDLTLQEWHDRFSGTITEFTSQDISQELSEFIGIELQDAEVIREAFRQEYERQIIQQEILFEETPANNVQALRNTRLKREEMMERYTNIFEVAYENTEFQDVIERKQTEIEWVLATDIEWFQTAFEAMIDGIEGIGEAMVNQFKWLLQHEGTDSIWELRAFFTRVETQDLGGVSEEIETSLTQGWSGLQDTLLNI